MPHAKGRNYYGKGHARRTSVAVTSLAAGEAPHHVQDGGADTQGRDDIDAVMIHTTTAARSSRLAAAQQLISVPRTRTELSRRHLAETRYRLMLDCAVTLIRLNDV